MSEVEELKELLAPFMCPDDCPGCSCHCGHPPCSHCLESHVSERSIDEARKSRSCLEKLENEVSNFRLR